MNDGLDGSCGITSGGNTKTTRETCTKEKKKRDNMHMYWFFTWYDYKDQEEHMDHMFRGMCDWFVFQEEICPSTCTPHIQGTLKLKKRSRFTEMQKIHNEIHWEWTRSIKKSIAYCSKEKTKMPNGKRWVYGIDIPEPLEYNEPYGWQLDIMDIIKEKPNDRTIHWIWEEKGGVGKSKLCKYLGIKHNALMVSGKSSDIYHALTAFPEKRKLILVDVPRSTQDYINYGAIEQVKNGFVFSGKYESTQLIFNCPHVIVFANEEPDYRKISEDRWDVRKIISCEDGHKLIKTIPKYR